MEPGPFEHLQWDCVGQLPVSKGICWQSCVRWLVILLPTHYALLQPGQLWRLFLSSFQCLVYLRLCRPIEVPTSCLVCLVWFCISFILTGQINRFFCARACGRDKGWGRPQGSTQILVWLYVNGFKRRLYEAGRLACEKLIVTQFTRRKSTSLRHVNLLKPYYDRSDTPAIQPVACITPRRWNNFHSCYNTCLKTKMETPELN